MSKVQRKRSMGAFFVVKKCSKNESGFYSGTKWRLEESLSWRIIRWKNTIIHIIHKEVHKRRYRTFRNESASNINYVFISGIFNKTWKGSDVSDSKCAVYNRIVNKNCMNYYSKCRKDRNEKLHDEEFQIKRVT